MKEMQNVQVNSVYTKVHELELSTHNAGSTNSNIGIPSIAEMIPYPYIPYYYPNCFQYAQYQFAPLQVPRDNVCYATTNATVQERPNKVIETTTNTAKTEEFLDHTKISDQTDNFYLFEHPGVGNRKSYKTEKRYITPHPKIVRKDGSKATNYNITVRLFDGDMKQEHPYNEHFICEPDRQTISSATDETKISVKVLINSVSSFRFLFDIDWNDGDNVKRERILTNCFQVKSNKALKRRGVEVKDFNPKKGRPNESTEVWIQGKFGKMIPSVKFDGVAAEITDCDSNLLKCIAPKREDIAESKKIKVEVVTPSGEEAHPTNFTFEYSV
jgi:hypothetical protein